MGKAYKRDITHDNINTKHRSMEVYSLADHTRQVFKMKKVELARGIYQFIFEPTAQFQYGNNIVAVLRGKKALLIDAGLEFQMAEVAEELNRDGIYVEGVILSHFHQGHVRGIKALQGVTIYGSCYYRQTLELWCPPEEWNYYTPTIQVGKGKRIKYGSHVIELLSNPGQTICTLMVRIDEEFLYIADELTYSSDSVLVLPRVTKDNLINHYVSVYNLAKYSNATIIPGHGRAITDSERIEKDIDDVCQYLCEIISHDEVLSVEQATSKCACCFLHTEWHQNAYH